MTRETCDLFAEFLSYPTPATLRVLNEEQEARQHRLRRDDQCPPPPGGADDGGGKKPDDPEGCIDAFVSAARALSPEELEELYTRTFDINPVASLEVGWHLYGEQYERGKFLVTARGLLRQFGVAESTELPDHLAHILRLLGRMDEEDARDFGGAYVVPAVAKIVAAFNDNASAGSNPAGNPYGHLVKGLDAFLAGYCTFSGGDCTP